MTGVQTCALPIFNSQDGTRAYLAAASGKMCITLIYKDGTMLIEAGENYWDILTYASLRHRSLQSHLSRQMADMLILIIRILYFHSFRI